MLTNYPFPMKKSLRAVEYNLLCEYVSVNSQGGLNFLGVFDQFTVKELPSQVPAMAIATKIIVPKGDHTIHFTLQQQDRILAKTQIEKVVSSPFTQHIHLWNIYNIQLLNSDPIDIHIFLSGQEIFVRKIPVIQENS